MITTISLPAILFSMLRVQPLFAQDAKSANKYY